MKVEWDNVVQEWRQINNVTETNKKYIEIEKFKSLSINQLIQ
jgi:hypothetical protein